MTKETKETPPLELEPEVIEVPVTNIGMFDEVDVPAAPEATVELMEATIIDRASGKAKYHITRPVDQMLTVILSALSADEGVVEGHVDLNKLVDPETGEISDMKEWAYTISPNTVTGLPEGTKAIVQGMTRAKVVDGTLHITAQWPQEVEVLIEHPAYGAEKINVPCEPTTEGLPEHAVPAIEDVLLLRKDAYMPDGDKWDLLIKGLKKLPGAKAIPELAAVMEDSDGVKSRFVKPEPQPKEV